LIAAAHEDADLLGSDLATIRDWLQISEYDSESLVALLLVHMLGAVQGSLCTELSPDNLARTLGELLSADEAATWTKRILAELDSPFPRLFGTGPDDDRPLIIYPVAGRRLLYFQKFLRHEL